MSIFLDLLMVLLGVILGVTVAFPAGVAHQAHTQGTEVNRCAERPEEECIAVPVSLVKHPGKVERCLPDPPGH